MTQVLTKTGADAEKISPMLFWANTSEEIKSQYIGKMNAIVVPRLCQPEPLRELCKHFYQRTGADLFVNIPPCLFLNSEHKFVFCNTVRPPSFPIKHCVIFFHQRIWS